MNDAKKYAVSSLNRREVLAGALALMAARTSRAAQGTIDIFPDEAIGTISPNIYGHFTEHLGGCIYDGIWVGEKSKIPNVSGIRKALVDQLKLLKPPVIRWPGGCFADSYNWRDGVGPRDKRPKRTNFWANNPYLQKAPDGPQKYDPNEFGTNEFARLCKLVGAQPYFAANVRSLSANDFYQWIEYCNSPAGTTSLSELRAQGGDPEPLAVRFWGVGNESWGCGGNFTGDEYAIEFRKFIEWVPRWDTPMSFIASGPNVADYAWTRSFLEKLTERNKRALGSVFGLALHYYCGPRPRKQAADFNDEEWYALLIAASRMEELIRNHWQIMGEVDNQRSVKLVVDEWGAWHETDPSIDPRYLWAYFPTLRDALVSSITLDIFNRHADKVAMANAAQMINNIHTSFLAVEDRFTVTPIYHVFRMYAAHQGGTSVRSVFNSAELSGLGGANAGGRLASLSGSCSLHGRHVVLTVTNPDAKNPKDAGINVSGGKIANVRATVLTDSDIHARNTFAQPNAVEPSEKSVASPDPFVYRFAPASITRLEFDLS